MQATTIIVIFDRIGAFSTTGSYRKRLIIPITPDITTAIKEMFSIKFNISIKSFFY